MSTTISTTEREEIRQAIADGRPFATYRNQGLWAREGRWDLYYFASQAAAEAFQAVNSGEVQQTTQDRVWRVAIRV